MRHRNPRLPRRSCRACLCAATAGVLFCCCGAFSATYTFTAAASQAWSNASNWSGGVKAVSADTTDIIFGSVPVNGSFQDIANPFALHSLTFNNNGQFLTGNQIAFNLPGFIQQNSTTATIFTDIAIGDQLTYDGSGSANFLGIISGAVNELFIKNGPGSMTLSAQNTFTGEVQINGGQVIVGGTQVIQNSTVAINVDNGLNLNGNQTVIISDLTGSGSLNIGSTLLKLGNRYSPIPPAYTGTITGGTGALSLGYGPVTFGGTGSSVHHLEVTGNLTLTGNGGFGAASMSATSGKPISTAADNALTVGTVHLSPQMPAYVSVQNGAVLNTIGELRAGTTLVAGSLTQPSVITVTGSGSRWRAGDFNYIGGVQGAGSVVVDAGGSITDAFNFYIGAGSAGAGSLVVQGGGTMTISHGILGSVAGAIGTATVSGANSLWTTTELGIGGNQGPGGTGTLNVNSGGAMISSNITELWTSASSINVNGGTFSTGSLYGDTGTVNLTDPAGGTAMIINGSGISPYSGAIRGSGSIIKDGPAIQFLNGENTYTGRTTVNGGTLILASGTSTSYTANNGSTLTLAFGDFGFSSLNANPGGIIHYNYPVIIGGFFHGAGNHDISGVTSFNGTTFGPGVVLTLSTPTLNNVTNSGTLNVSGVTWSGGYNTAAGSITIGGSLTVSEFENTGSITVTRRSSLISNGTNLVSGAGGRINVNTQGAIVLNAGSLDLYGSLLINNGTIDGTTNVNYGALAKGSGRYGDVNVTDGGKFSPGNSPGSVTTGSTTWNSGGGYLVEVADALSDGGRDFWLIDGQLNLNASSEHPFTISLASIDGLMFDNTRDYTWPILQASGGIAGFDPSDVVLDISGFKNNLGTGHFTLEPTQTDFVIHFSAVPEPAALLALVGGFLINCRRPSGRKPDRTPV